MPDQSMPETQRSAEYDEIEYSLEVANFLDVLGRIVTRLFGVEEDNHDNEDDLSGSLCVTEEE